ncbi:MAG: hypothetical protein QM655_04290 [Nocardioidaceae bacterium]
MMKNDKEDGDRFVEEFRRELEAYGLEAPEYAPQPGDDERAERELARIVALPQSKMARLRRFAGTGSSWRPRKTVWSVGLVVAVLVAIVFTVVRPLGSEYVAQAGTPPLLRFDGVEAGDLPSSGRPAGNVLVELAGKARNLPGSGDEPVQRVVLDGWFAESGGEIGAPVETVLRPVRRESYFLPDNTVRVIEERGPPLDQEGQITTVGDDSVPGRVDESFASPDPGAAYARKLPIQPAALGQVLLGDYDPTTPVGGALLFQISNIARTYVIPPAVLATMWEVMAEEPTITLLGTTRDRLGRQALVFSALAIDGISQQLLLADPATGAILGDETVLVKPSDAYAFTPPAVTSFTTIISSERVGTSQLPTRSP